MTPPRMILYYVALTTEIFVMDPTNKDSLPNSNVAVVSLNLKEILLVGLILKNPYVWDP
jgi:type III secretory pathway component EscR